jgi:hypothetical protein
MYTDRDDHERKLGDKMYGTGSWYPNMDDMTVRCIMLSAPTVQNNSLGSIPAFFDIPDSEEWQKALPGTLANPKIFYPGTGNSNYPS